MGGVEGATQHYLGLFKSKAPAATAFRPVTPTADIRCSLIGLLKTLFPSLSFLTHTYPTHLNPSNQPSTTHVLPVLHLHCLQLSHSIM